MALFFLAEGSCDSLSRATGKTSFPQISSIANRDTRNIRRGRFPTDSASLIDVLPACRFAHGRITRRMTSHRPKSQIQSAHFFNSKGKAKMPPPLPRRQTIKTRKMPSPAVGCESTIHFSPHGTWENGFGADGPRLISLARVPKCSAPLPHSVSTNPGPGVDWFQRERPVLMWAVMREGAQIRADDA